MGKYKGMAPGSRIAALKVLDRFGNGNKEDVLQAFRWILQNRERYRIRIVNISVGTTYRTRNDQDVLVQGVERLWDEGLVVVAAGAGNLYSMKSGTSMSTPLVSGAIALALEKDSLLSNVEIKMMLRDSCDDMGLPRNQQGWGKFNCKKFLAL